MLNKEQFEAFCKSLPDGLHWGDPITPHVLQQIVEAMRAQADAQPIAWQYRSKHNGGIGGYEWEELKPRGPGQSMENRVKEMQSFIDGGVSYEMRPLYTHPAPEAAQALSDWNRISRAAQAANQQYGQWMPERWLQLFVKAYNGGKQ